MTPPLFNLPLRSELNELFLTRIASIPSKTYIMFFGNWNSQTAFVYAISKILYPNC